MRHLPLLAVLTMSSGMVFAQNLPIKMGLWEKTVDVTNPMGKPMTTTAKSCVTPATWQRMVTNAQKPRDNCKIDTTKVASGYTFSASCAVGNGMTMEISGTSKITDSEHITSETHSVFTMNGQKRDTTIHATSRFLSSDCGNVKPDDPEPAGK